MVLKKIEDLETRLKELNGQFEFSVHNELRHLYASKGSSDLNSSDTRKSIQHMEIILENSVMNKYILSVLSSHKKDLDHKLNSLLINAEFHKHFELVVAACYLQAALFTQDRKKGLEYVAKVLELPSERTKPYKKLAETRRDELLNTN